jgi:hypothetical protein
MAQQKMIPTNGVVALRKMVCLQTNSKKGRCAMGLLGKKIIKEIRDGTWRHLVNKHNIDVDTISKELRCVEREGVLNGGEPVTFLRVFKPAEAKQRGIAVTGWDTFDEHPDLILFEGYLTRANEAHLDRWK